MRKVLFTGPESTGKTTLSKWGADEVGGQYIPEFSRAWLKDREKPYTYPDLLTIAKGQKESEEKIIQQNGKVSFYDTSFLVLQIWSQYKFGKCDPWIIEQFKMMDFEVIFLCSPEGVEWEYDPLRESPYEREILFKLYEDALKGAGKEFKTLTGSLDSRKMEILHYFQGEER